MVQIYKKILRGEGNRGKKASPPNPSPNGEGSSMRDTPIS